MVPNVETFQHIHITYKTTVEALQPPWGRIDDRNPCSMTGKPSNISMRQMRLKSQKEKRAIKEVAPKWIYPSD
jgi:hypothetical protein